MQLGINLGYWGAGNDADNLVTAVEADRLGYAVAWVAEAYGSDAPTVLAWIGAQTERIDLGAAVMQIPARTPATTAMTAATIDTLSGGRFRLGLGVSGPQVTEGWHGVPFAAPLGRTREYVDIVRMASAPGNRCVPRQALAAPDPGGPGKALKLTVHPVRPEVPIYLAAVGPKNLELAGEIADGWLAIFYSPEHSGDLLESVRPAAQGREGHPGRPLDRVRRRANGSGRRRRRRRAGGAGDLGVRGALHRRDGLARPELLQPLACRMGFEEDAARIQDLYLDGGTGTPRRQCRSSSSTRPR